jgi:hypothetical protein
MPRTEKGPPEFNFTAEGFTASCGSFFPPEFVLTLSAKDRLPNLAADSFNPGMQPILRYAPAWLHSFFC